MRIDPLQRIAGAVSEGMAVANVHMPDTLAEFCEDRKLLIDGRRFDLVRYSYLDPIYRKICTKKNLMGGDFRLVLMFGAQTGKTALMATLMAYLSLLHARSSWGYYFPTEMLARIFSTERFRKIIESNQGLMRYYTSDEVVDRTQNVSVRHFGLSTLYFLWTSGRATTESLPLWGVMFDEVRRIPPGDIERTEKRITASPFKINIKVSTAGYPDSDIDSYFKRSNQNYWHSRCLCPDGCCLALTFPDCLHRGPFRYVCPVCHAPIPNPRNGFFKPHNPDSPIWGFQIPQMLSPDVSPEQIWEQNITMRDRQEFWNSVIGVPWVSADTQPISESVFRACVDPTARWEIESQPGQVYMGVDQRGGENHVVILRLVDRRPRIIHLEVVQGDSPFDRLYRLMDQYSVGVCVIDLNPNYNEALRFAKAHLERVFLCTYHDVPERVRWVDKTKRPEAIRKSKYEDQFQYLVRADRYKTIDNALSLFTRGEIRIPPPESMVQNLWLNGQELPTQIALGNFVDKTPGLLAHLMSVARTRTPVYKSGPDGQQIDTGEIRMEWANLRGVDPHFLHALNYGLIAAERRGESMIMSDEPPKVSASPQLDGLRKSIHMQAGILPRPDRERCGTCVRFENGNSCQVLHAATGANDPACEHGYQSDRVDPDTGEARGYIIV